MTFDTDNSHSYKVSMKYCLQVNNYKQGHGEDLVMSTKFNIGSDTRFEVFMTLKIHVEVFWIVALFSNVVGYQSECNIMTVDIGQQLRQDAIIQNHSLCPTYCIFCVENIQQSVC
jgi:hypothetical protein